MRQQIWGEVVDFIRAFFQFIWECNSENIIKIGPYLPKLLQEKFGAVFLAHPVYHIAYVRVGQWETVDKWPTEVRSTVHRGYATGSDRMAPAVSSVTNPPLCDSRGPQQTDRQAQSLVSVDYWGHSRLLLIAAAQGLPINAMGAAYGS